LIYSNAAASLPKALAQPVGTLLVMLGEAVSFCIVAFATGWLVARLLRASPAEEASLVFSLGMSNNGTGLVLASVALAGHPQVLLVIVCYNLVQHLVAGTVDAARRRGLASLERAEAALSAWQMRLAGALQPFASFVFSLLTAVLLVNACASYWSVLRVAATNRAVVHTYRVIKEINDTLSLLKDAETGQRGYLLTGRDDYLRPYTAAVKAIPKRLERLRELTADNPGQQERLARLEPEVKAKLAELRRAVAARRDQGEAAALAVVRAGHAKRHMDAARKTLAEMEAAEERRLERRTANADRRTSRALGTAVVLGGLVLVCHLLLGLARGGRPSPSRQPDAVVRD
jgi:CHASE3 domain sensor protein